MRVRMFFKMKAKNYIESYKINVIDGWREGNIWLVVGYERYVGML